MGNIADKASNSLKLRFKMLGSHIVPCGTFLRFFSPPAKNEKYYSQTPLSGHPINTGTVLLRTVCFAPGGRNPYMLSNFNPLNTETPSRKDTPAQCPYQRSLTLLTLIKGKKVNLYTR